MTFLFNPALCFSKAGSFLLELSSDEHLLFFLFSSSLLSDKTSAYDFFGVSESDDEIWWASKDFLREERGLLGIQSDIKVMNDKKVFQPFLLVLSGTKILHFLLLLSIMKTSVVLPDLLLFFIFLTHMQLSAYLFSMKKCLFVGLSISCLKLFLTQSSVFDVISIEKLLWWQTSVNHILRNFVLLSFWKNCCLTLHVVVFKKNYLWFM